MATLGETVELVNGFVARIRRDERTEFVRRARKAMTQLPILTSKFDVECSMFCGSVPCGVGETGFLPVVAYTALSAILPRWRTQE